jgi:hypothetical protein
MDSGVEDHGSSKTSPPRQMLPEGTVLARPGACEGLLRPGCICHQALNIDPIELSA